MAAPHPALAREEVPDLPDRAVRHRARDLPRSEGMRAKAARRLGEEPHLAAVRRDRVGLDRQRLGGYFDHRSRRSDAAVGVDRGKRNFDANRLQLERRPPSSAFQRHRPSARCAARGARATRSCRRASSSTWRGMIAKSGSARLWRGRAWRPGGRPAGHDLLDGRRVGPPFHARRDLISGHLRERIDHLADRHRDARQGVIMRVMPNAAGGSSNARIRASTTRRGDRMYMAASRATGQIASCRPAARG